LTPAKLPTANMIASIAITKTMKKTAAHTSTKAG
jgi:hypothetical protein